MILILAATDNINGRYGDPCVPGYGLRYGLGYGQGCRMLFLVLVVLLSLPPPALAADGWYAPGLLAQEAGKGNDRQFSPRPRDGDGPDRNPDEVRQVVPHQQRLSPDERRQLRREVHDANRDLRPRRGEPRR